MALPPDDITAGHSPRDSDPASSEVPAVEKSLGEAVTGGDVSRRVVSQGPSLGEQSTAGGLESSISDFSDLVGGLDNVGEVVELEARYEIQGSLGSGGMGLVQRAVDRRLQRSVAIKRLKTELAGSRSAARRFLSEAQAVATLNHFNIVQVYDYGYATDGPFIVMELVEGQSLKERLAEGPLELEAAVELTGQLCDALSVAHGWGIVHRDIKPGNILLTADGVPKLSDFGLARQERADDGQTKTGAVLGTLDFMSPEQKEDATSVDSRSDLWSLAATLYQMVTGELPRVIRGDRLDPALSTVVLKALEDDPERRYASAEEFGEALREAVVARAESLSASRYEIDEGSCAHCGEENELTRKFCRGCGQTLHDPCLNCRSPLPVWERFCGECGVDVLEELQQQLAAFPTQRQEIASLRRSYRYSEAVEQLQSLVSVGHSRLGEQSSWAEKALSVIGQEFSEWETRREALLAAAGEHLAEGKDRAARGFLNEIPEPLHTAEVTGLLEKLATRRDEAKMLAQSIRSAVRSRDDATMRPLLERFLELRPGDKQAGVLLEQLRDRETETVFGDIESTASEIASGDDHSYTPVLSRRVRRRALWQRNKLVVPIVSAVAVVVVGLVAFTLFRAGPADPEPVHQEVAERTAVDQSVGDPVQADDGRPSVAETTGQLHGTLKLTLKGHAGNVWGVVFSPDGRQIGTSSFDGSVKLWDVATGEEVKDFTGHRDRVYGLAVSPDGRLFASGGSRGVGGKFPAEIKIWDVLTGESLSSLKRLSGGSPVCLAFSPDGKLLASASEDLAVKIWDMSTRTVLATLSGHAGRVFGVAFSADGGLLVSCDEQHAVKVWNRSQGWGVSTLNGHTDAVRSVCFSPDGKTLASTGHDRTVRLWDVATGNEVRSIFGHTDRVWWVTYSPDGGRLATASGDKTVRIWDASDGRELLKLTGTDEFLAVAFSPDGKLLAAGSRDKTAWVWDLVTQQAATLSQPTEIPNKTGVSSGLSDRTDAPARVSREETKAVLLERPVSATVAHSFGGTPGRTVASFSPDGTRIASLSDGNTLTVWDARTAQEVLTLRKHLDIVHSVGFSPDGKRIVSGSLDKTLKVWDAVTGQELLTLKGHLKGVLTAAFSPDGKRIVSGGYDGVKVWNAITGQELWTLKGHADGVLSVVFSPDGKSVVSGGYDETVKVWDAQSGQERLVLEGHTGPVDSVSLSPDGRWIVSGSRDSSAKLWDVETGLVTLEFNGHQGWVLSARFSPDGNWIVSSSSDMSLRVWNAQTAQEMFSRKLSNWVHSVMFSPDGQQILSAGTETSNVLWDLMTQQVPALSQPTETPNKTGRLFLSDVSPTWVKGRGFFTAKVRGTPIGPKSGHEKWRVQGKQTPNDIHVHPPPNDYAEIRYQLGKWSGRFVGVVGIADGVVSRTPLRFLVLADNKQLWRSRLLQDGGEWDRFDLAVDGVQELKLRVQCNGANNYAHAMWIAPCLLGGPISETTSEQQKDSNSRFLAEECPASFDVEWENGWGFGNRGCPGGNPASRISVNSRHFRWGIGAHPGSHPVRNSRIFYRLASKYTELGGQVALNGNCSPKSSVVFSILGDGKELWRSVPIGRPNVVVNFRVKLAGVDVLELRASPTGDSNGCHAVWLDPVLERASRSDGLDSTPLDGVPSGSDLAVPRGRRKSVAQPAFTLIHGASEVYAAGFSPDGTRLATAGKDHLVKVWDLATQKESAILRGHSGWVRSVDFSRDGRWIVSASQDRTVKLWDATTLLHVRTYTGDTEHAYGVSFSPTGKWILSGGFSGTLKMWETTSGRLVASMKGYNNVAFDPRGGWIASSGGKDGTVWMWRKINSRLDGWRKKVLVGHAGHVNDISFSPDGKRLASVSEDRSAIVWDTQTGKTLMTLRGHTDVVRGVSYSPDGRFLATASFDKTAKIWDTSTGSEVTTLRGHSDKLWDVVFSPKGLRLATSCWDGTVKVWDLSTGGKPKK